MTKLRFKPVKTAIYAHTVLEEKEADLVFVECGNYVACRDYEIYQQARSALKAIPATRLNGKFPCFLMDGLTVGVMRQRLDLQEV